MTPVKWPSDFRRLFRGAYVPLRVLIKRQAECTIFTRDIVSQVRTSNQSFGSLPTRFWRRDVVIIAAFLAPLEQHDE